MRPGLAGQWYNICRFQRIDLIGNIGQPAAQRRHATCGAPRSTVAAIQHAPAPITQDVLREAARLRALIPGLKTPDAIHAATALVHGCALFVTSDVGFRRVPGLTLAILDDILDDILAAA